MMDDDDEFDGDRDDEVPTCDLCHDSGKVVTDDYESCLGASYKPCPRCNHGASQASIGEGNQLS